MELTKSRTLRDVILARRDALSIENRLRKSRRICKKLLDLEAVHSAETVFVYMHFRSEVQTMEFINQCLAAGKAVTIPITLKEERRLLAVQVVDLFKDVAPGYCGIPEPTKKRVSIATYDPAGIDVAIVPGSVFDRFGGRLGYGGGYYDRFLAQEAPRAFRIGLAFETQLTDLVPVQPHDQFMDLVVTEENMYDYRRMRNAQDSRLS